MFRRYGIVDDSDRLSVLDAETRCASDQLQKALSSVSSHANLILVGAAGLEPATAGLEIRCSIQLSYAPSARYFVRLIKNTLVNRRRGMQRSKGGAHW